MNLTQGLRTGSGKGSNEKEWASFEERRVKRVLQ